MSDYVYQTTTNDKKNSQYDVTGHLMPARAFFFVVVEEVGKDGFLVRNCYTSIQDSYLKELKLTDIGNLREVFPEKYGLWGKGPNSTAGIVEHVLQFEQVTSYASTSSVYPGGAERFAGKTVYVDIAKAKRAGAKLVTTQEIIQAIDQYAASVPSKEKRWSEHIKRKVMTFDKEVLIQPNPSVPANGVFTKRGLGISLGVVKYARVVQVVGLAFTGYDLAVAIKQSVHFKSMRPIEKEVVRQSGGWAGAVAGARVGATAGAMVGIELGPGTVITGLIGGIVFGAVGYFWGSWLADQIPNN